LSSSGEILANSEDAPLPVPALASAQPAATTTNVQLISAHSRSAHIHGHSSDSDLALTTIKDDRREIAFPHLQWLRVGAITMFGLSKLIIPHVRFLVIQTALRDYTKPAPPPHSIVLPEVQVLHVSTVHPHISAIVAPNLKTFCLQIQVLKKSDASGILQGVFDDHPRMLRPEHLSVNLLAHDKHIISTLRKLKDLKTLTLTLQDHPKKALFDGLKKSTLVPNLTGLTLDLQSSVDKSVDKRQRYIAERMEEVKAARARVGKLSWLSVKWNGVEQVFVQCDMCNPMRAGQVSG